MTKAQRPLVIAHPSERDQAIREHRQRETLRIVEDVRTVERQRLVRRVFRGQPGVL